MQLHTAMADSDRLHTTKCEPTLNAVTIHGAVSSGCCIATRAPNLRWALTMRRAVHLVPIPATPTFAATPIAMHLGFPPILLALFMQPGRSPPYWLRYRTSNSCTVWLALMRAVA